MTFLVVTIFDGRDIHTSFTSVLQYVLIFQRISKKRMTINK